MDLEQALRASQPSAHVDILLLDTEVANDENWPAKVVQMTRVLPRSPLIAATEIRAASLDEQIDQVLGRDQINQQLAERKKKLAEKNA